MESTIKTFYVVCIKLLYTIIPINILEKIEDLKNLQTVIHSHILKSKHSSKKSTIKAMRKISYNLFPEDLHNNMSSWHLKWFSFKLDNRSKSWFILILNDTRLCTGKRARQTEDRRVTIQGISDEDTQKNYSLLKYTFFPKFFNIRELPYCHENWTYSSVSGLSVSEKFKSGR